MMQGSSSWQSLRPFVLLVGVLDIARADVDFNRDVRPILAGHCFECHGPDAEERQGKLRLDNEAAAHAKVIVAGHSDSSELYARVITQDPDEIMPPLAKKNPLTQSQKEVLKRWIEEGAPYAPHWSFVPPSRPNVPEVTVPEAAQNSIDRFVIARLEQQQLELSAVPPLTQRARRAALSLVGVPPTSQETEMLLEDGSPNAYARYIDRLLASPLYGERWARRWLDLARYADTNGYEKDRQRSIWPYRDWVINALNADMPFDQFTIEQLAGDMLPNATTDQRIATGFHRNTMLNEEGGIDPLEYRFHSLVDRVGTTGTVWLGLTVACAQCHTHKFDPILHTDYYQLMAYLNNADEPELTLPTPDPNNVISTLRQREASLIQQVDEGKFTQWCHQQAQEIGNWQVRLPTTVATNLAKVKPLDDGSLLVTGDLTKRDVYTLTFHGSFATTTAIRLEALPHPTLPRSGPGRAYYEGPKGDFFLSELKLEADGQRHAFVSATESYGKLGIGGGSGKASQAIDGNEVTGWSTSGQEGQANQAVFTLDQPLAATKTLTITLEFNRHYPASLGRFRVSFTQDPVAQQARSLSVDLDTILTKPAKTWTDDERQRLQTAYALQADETSAERDAIAALRQQRPKPISTLIFRERPADHPRPTFRHHRGEFLQAKEPITAALPSLFANSATTTPTDRLGFARWLVSPDNPLMGRVTVNRHWAALFGRGLVSTTEDFGYQGASPTHPALLDWLAMQFQEDRWSRKRLHQHIVSSATFQQASTVTETHRQRDPENRWLARAPRFRIDGELIRDTALSVAGLLTHKLGGPSVFPPQPASVTTEGAYGQLKWTVSKGEDRFRRGLYTFAKRTAPYAMFSTFDAGSGEACLARREITNTPLQALTALNDEVILEAARELGRRLVAEQSSDRSRANALFQQVLTRLPADDERVWLLDFVTGQRAHFSQEEAKALLLLGIDDPSKTSMLPDQAAWATAARALLNLDETFMHQ